MADDVPDGIDIEALLAEANEPETSAEHANRDFETTVTRLAALPAQHYDRVRIDESNRLGVRVRVLDDAVNGKRSGTAGNDTQGRTVEWPKPEPWPQVVEGTTLLSTLADTIGHYVAISPPLADAVALWTVTTWLHDRLEISTFLNITSPTKRCGKSVLMEVLGEFVYRPMPAAGRVTPAALFRLIERHEPTLLLDEIDTYLAKDPEIRGIINGSQRHAGAFVLRCVGEDYEPRRFKTWCPKAIAGIGGLPDTVLDRALVIRLARRPPERRLPLWRDRDKAAIASLQRQIIRWVNDTKAEVLTKRQAIAFPVGLHDRARDAWESLLAVAEAAGGEWGGQGGRAWCAAEHVSADVQEETGAREMLLADLRVVFRDAGDPDKLPTSQILEALCGMEGRPWSEWRRGQPLSPRGLAKLLQPFNVRPRTERFARGGAKGYRRDALVPVWDAYLAEVRGSASVTPLQVN